MHHYCCHRLWFPPTSSERIVQNLKWFPSYDVKMPFASRDALIIHCSTGTHCITNRQRPQQPNPPLETVTRQNLQKLSAMFGTSTANQAPKAIPADTTVVNPASLPRVTTQTIPTRKVIPNLVRLPRVTPAPQNIPNVKKSLPNH